MSHRSDLAIVIPTLDRPGLLTRALEHLDRQRGEALGRFEVVIARDAASAAPPQPLGPHPYPVHSVEAERHGASAARNAGFRATDAPLVLFLDDDVLATRRLVSTHLKVHAEYPQAETGVLGLVRWPRWPPPTAFMRWLDQGIQFDYSPLVPGAVAPWWHFYTANASVKREMLERVGGFDEQRFPFGYEDLDLAARMSDHGFRLHYEPAALARHLHRQGLVEWREGRVQRIAAAERCFCARHPQALPYFHDLFLAAREHPPARGRGARLAPLVPQRTPWVGRQVWASVDMCNRQALAGPFLEAWDAAEAQVPT
jgi:glycosyltransferase involved in cell wall biosynthesis